MKKVYNDLSLIAYYLSEYDKKAIRELGYNSATQAMLEISQTLGHANNYLKLRRDEFDALPTSSSHRKGWRNRPPTPEVVSIAEKMNTLSFEELTVLVTSIIEEYTTEHIYGVIEQSNITPTNALTEKEIEAIINATDPNASIQVKLVENRIRKYNPSIVNTLKKLYNGKCQICGKECIEGMHVDITEAHHIKYFSESQNNNANNIMILCPNHHVLIHALNPHFNRSTLEFIFSNGAKLKVKYNIHLADDLEKF